MPYDKTKDPLYALAATAISTGRKMAAVTPSDATDLTIYAKSLYVQTGGVIKFLPVENDDADVIPLTVADKTVIDFVQVRRVVSTGTTASGIFAIWN
jgi:hypothetical protein